MADVPLQDVVASYEKTIHMLRRKGEDVMLLQALAEMGLVSPTCTLNMGLLVCSFPHLSECAVLGPPLFVFTGPHEQWWRVWPRRSCEDVD